MTPYDAAKILGISGNITPEIAKKAHRAACKKYHPDINPAGENMMKLVINGPIRKKHGISAPTNIAAVAVVSPAWKKFARNTAVIDSKAWGFEE